MGQNGVGGRRWGGGVGGLIAPCGLSVAVECTCMLLLLFYSGIFDFFLTKICPLVPLWFVPV